MSNIPEKNLSSDEAQSQTCLTVKHQYLMRHQSKKQRFASVLATSVLYSDMSTFDITFSSFTFYNIDKS